VSSSREPTPLEVFGQRNRSSWVSRPAGV
jgi:hypothetical protein